MSDDLVDEFYRPFVEPLGNLVILFAQCEAALLDLTAMLCGGDEVRAVQILKEENAKERLIELVRATGLSGFDLDEMVIGLGDFWCDKNIRNRLIHDDWYPSLSIPGGVNTRGLTRKKVPEEIFGEPTVADIWELAARFRYYEYLFSHRAWALAP